MTLKNAFGSVKPYTRHIISCSHRDNSDHNACKCPKWLYQYRKGDKPKRHSLNTPSWAEAQRIAANTLRGFDPEIAEARATKTKQQMKMMTVADACKLWIARTESQFGSDCGSLPQYKSLMKKLDDWAAGQSIEYVQEITPLQLQMWYSSGDWSRYAAPTRSQRWGILRSMFTFLQERGVQSSRFASAEDMCRVHTLTSRSPGYLRMSRTRYPQRVGLRSRLSTSSG